MPPHGVNEHYEALGLESYGLESLKPNVVMRRPTFRFPPVIDLYKHKLPALHERLLQDDGSSLDREDPKLFDKELDGILTQLGPLIWPPHGQGNRGHLRKPDPNSHYISDLVYPRDSSTLKSEMRSVILKEQKCPSRDSKKRPGSAPFTPVSRGKSRKTVSTLSARRFKSKMVDGDDSTSGSENGSPSVETRRQAPQRSNKDTSDASLQLEMRLYRITATVFPPVLFLGNVLIQGNCTLDECFSRISEYTEAECDWIVFQLPEDISRESKVRIRRRSRSSEVDFRGVLDLLCQVLEVRGVSRRSVEVEVGLDMSTS